MQAKDAWKLEDLYSSPSDESFRNDLQLIESKVAELEDWESKMQAVDSKSLIKILSMIEEISKLSEKVEGFSYLFFS